MNVRKLLIGLIPIAIGAGTAQADYVWGGGEATWNTGAAWVGGAAPARNTSENVTISAGICSYESGAAGGDFALSGMLTINGTGKWTQSAGGNWGTVNGEIVVEGGGVFDTGVMPYFRTTKNVTVGNGGTIFFQCGAGVQSNAARLYLKEGGTIETKGDWVSGNDGLIPLTLEGGAFTVGGTSAKFTALAENELLSGTISAKTFEIPSTARLSGTVVQSDVINIAASTGEFKLSAGSISVDYAASGNGITTSGGYVSFAPNSKAKILVKNIGSSSAYAAYGETGKIRANGTVLTQAAWAESVAETVVEDGIELSWCASTAGVAFADPGCGIFARDTSAGTVTIVAHVDVIDDAGTELFLVYGEEDGGTSELADWAHTVELGAITEAGDFKGTIPLPAADAKSYYRMVLKNSVGRLVWATPAPVTVISDGSVFQWMGGNDLWAAGTKWSTGSVPAGGSKVLIEQGTVEYSVKSDLNYWGQMTIRDGGVLNYTSGSWPQLRSGKIFVENGGALLFPTVGCVNLFTAMPIRLAEGGRMQLKGTTGGGDDRPGSIEVEGGTLVVTDNWIPYNGNATRQTSIKLNAGTVEIAGKYTSKSADELKGGAMTVGATVEIPGDLTIAGASVTANGGLSFTVADKVLKLTAGRLYLPKAGSAANHGLAQKNAGNSIDLSVGEDAVLAFGDVSPTLEGCDLDNEVYTTWFGGADPLVKIDGVAVASISAFTRLVQVTRTEEGVVEITRKEIADPPVFGETTVVASEGKATFSAAVSASGGTATHLYLVWGDAVGGVTPSEWKHAEDMGVVATGQSYTKDVTIGDTEFFVWNFIMLNDEVCLSANAQTRYAFGSKCNVWTGVTSQDPADATNWLGGVVPTAESRVLVMDGLAVDGMTYANDGVLPRTIGGWYQTAAVDVVIDSSLTDVLSVTGDVELAAGRLLCMAAAVNQTKGLCLDIGGNLTIGGKASLSVSSRGNKQSGVGRVDWRAGSFVGEGGRHRQDGTFANPEQDEFVEGTYRCVTYGKALDPLHVGSGAHDANAASGGLVVLRVAGCSTIDGAIAADGYGWKNAHGAGSAGSINLKTGTLVGGGSIHARGGFDTGEGNNDNGCGSGGRIRLKLTQTGADFTGFTGTVFADSILGHKDNQEADGKTWVDRTVIGGAGTIAYQLPTDGDNAGRVVVQNKDWTVLGNYPFANCGGYRQFGSTHIPAMRDADDDLSNTDWVLDGQWTHAKLMQDMVKLGSLTLKNGAILKLRGRTLKLKQLWIGDQKVSGTITAKTHPELFKTITGTAANDLTRTPAAGGYFEDLVDAPGTVIVEQGFVITIK